MNTYQMIDALEGRMFELASRDMDWDSFRANIIDSKRHFIDNWYLAKATSQLFNETNPINELQKALIGAADAAAKLAYGFKRLEDSFQVEYSNLTRYEKAMFQIGITWDFESYHKSLWLWGILITWRGMLKGLDIGWGD